MKKRGAKNITIDELAAMVQRGFDGVDKRFGEIDKRFNRVDERFDEMKNYIDKRIDSLDLSIDTKLASYTNFWNRKFSEHEV